MTSMVALFNFITGRDLQSNGRTATNRLLLAFPNGMISGLTIDEIEQYLKECEKPPSDVDT